MGVGLQNVLAPKQSQRHLLAPVMRLGVDMLALPINELKAAVKKEIDSNPAVEASFPLILPRMAGLTGENGFLIDNARARGETLAEHLLSELRMMNLSPREFELCAAIACELDETGYFRGELPSMMMTLGASEDELERARQKVMTIDPKGCGARNLKECLLAQIGRIPAKDREMFRAGIEHILEGKVDAAVKPYVRQLKAAPGRDYEYVKVNYVTPDIALDRQGHVEVDTREIPELKVSQKYVEMAKDKTLDDETRKYAEEKVARARDFSVALRRRQETLEQIAEIALTRQKDFLAKGASGIRALTMSEVAREAKCSVSTVSRAAQRKFVKTPHGTMPFRSFFSINDRAPIEKLREILQSLPPGQTLTDKQAAAEMAKAGYSFARRTIAKYRAQLGLKKTAATKATA